MRTPARAPPSLKNTTPIFGWPPVSDDVTQKFPGADWPTVKEPQPVAPGAAGARARTMGIPCRVLNELGACSEPENSPLLTLYSGTAVPMFSPSALNSIAMPGGAGTGERGTRFAGAAVKRLGV